MPPRRPSGPRTAVLTLLSVAAAGLLLTTSAVAQPKPTQLFVFVYRQGPAWDPKLPMGKQAAMARHGAYMKRLFDEGRSFAAGPISDAPGGIVILRAASREEAAGLMARDPSITSGMFVGEVLPWSPVFRSDKPLP
ncbi:MAG TPA: YciI family protein [Phenylobacterium sp.]|jgi:uncharacterized protein YciI|nr:YciI family protein [Phenylobacterium sp.]